MQQRLAIGLATVLAAGVAAWSFAGIYSDRHPAQDYLTPTRRLLQAGMALDSTALAGMDIAPEALDWALRTGRDNPVLLRDLLSGLRSEGGMHNGDRSVVWFRTNGFETCHGWPLRVRFSGSPVTTRIEEVIVSCRPN